MVLARIFDQDFDSERDAKKFIEKAFGKNIKWSRNGRFISVMRKSKIKGIADQFIAEIVLPLKHWTPS